LPTFFPLLVAASPVSRESPVDGGSRGIIAEGVAGYSVKHLPLSLSLLLLLLLDDEVSSYMSVLCTSGVFGETVFIVRCDEPIDED